MIKNLRRGAGVLWLAVTLGGMPGARAADTVNLVKPAERSAHFAAVHQHLELGGTLYGYADVDGDVLKLADTLREIMTQVAEAQPEVAPVLKQDFRALAGILGLDDIKAFGLSSVPEGDGFFRNRVFFHTPNGRHGLLAGLGGAPAPFAKLKLAPAGTDLYSETEMDLAEVYRTLKAVVTKVGGETAANLMEDKITKAGKQGGIPLLELINSWKGHVALVLRLEPEQTLALPGLVIPAPSFLLCIDGIAPSLEPLLKANKNLKVVKEKGRTIYSSAQPLPLQGLDPVIVVEGRTLYVATTPAYFKECISQQSGLAQSADFQKALAPLGKTGNGLLYASPALFARIHDLKRMNPNLPEKNVQVLDILLRNTPQPAQPLVMVRTNLPEGILVRSHLNRSLKQDVAVMAMYNPVTVGMLAAMAIPAFQKVRTSSQEKAILNNLRQLAAASDQYYLEHGVDTVELDKLVGPDGYIRSLTPVAGEDYNEVILKVGEPLVVRLPDGREVRYDP